MKKKMCELVRLKQGHTNQGAVLAKVEKFAHLES